MKIAIFSDNHGYLPKDIKANLVCICGDVTPTFSHSREYQEEWCINTFGPWIMSQSKVLLVPGNHDFIFQDFEFIENFEKMCQGKLEVLINKKYLIVDQNDRKWWIFGTPYCKQFGNWAFMCPPDELEAHYDWIPDNTDILLCHDAPKIGPVGMINEGPWLGEHCGNPQLAKRILEINPQYVFHGHIHSSVSSYQEGDIEIRNVSLKNEQYKVVNGVTYLEL